MLKGKGKTEGEILSTGTFCTHAYSGNSWMMSLAECEQRSVTLWLRASGSSTICLFVVGILLIYKYWIRITD
jgi:hypothetical protein